jgi:DNA-binding IscR family transcriptional regulator
MTRSLKALIPKIASALGTTPAALYERQRALVRAGLLHPLPGHGPGSGVRATPESVALLLIALLATSSLTETEGQTARIMNLKSANKRCPLTGKKTFSTALAAVLASEELAKRVQTVGVERGGDQAHAEIIFNKEAETVSSSFGFVDKTYEAGLVAAAAIWLSFDAIARDLGESAK